MRNFEREAIIQSFIPDCLAAVLLFIYLFISARVDFDYVRSIAKVFFPILFVLQFIFAIFTDHLCYKRISAQLKTFYSSKTSSYERTRLFEDLMQYPMYTALMTFVYFLIGIVLLSVYIKLTGQPYPSFVVLFFAEGCFGVYVASIIGYNVCKKIVSSISFDIIREGIDRNYVMGKKFFGMKIRSKLFFYVVLPVLFMCVINSVIVVAGIFLDGGAVDEVAKQLQLERMAFTCTLNTVVLLFTILIFLSDLNFKSKKMYTALMEMTETDFTKIHPIDTDISDEFSYSHYLVNQLVSMFRGILFQTAEYGKTISRSASNLMRIFNETESTSSEQSNGIKEIVSMMGKITNLSHNIENRIAEVTEIARKTSEKVNSGYELLDRSLASITTISGANEVTLGGIKNLNEKVTSIWKIANIIDGISDQTKMIAFNAELEAVSNGNENKGFANVSTEIRRLANSTMDSTKEIKERINSIQESSLALIKTSEESADLVKQETELAVALEDKFVNIANSAKSNSVSANEIKYLIEQQSKSFDQIANTLQQISGSTQNISLSTRTLIETSQNLQENVGLIEAANISSVQEDEDDD